MKITDYAYYKYFETKEEIKACLEKDKEEYHVDFADIGHRWTGPGKYFVYTEKDRCPKGCCWDYTRTAEPVSSRIYDLVEQIKELAEELKLARAK